MFDIGKQIIENIKKNYPENSHPRLIMTKEKIDFWKNQIGKENIYNKMFEYQKEKADAFLNKPTGHFSVPDGIRILGNDRGWILTIPPLLGFYYLITGEKKYANRAIQELLALADYPSWNPFHFLDIGDISTAVALGYDWCYDAMTADEREKIRLAINKFAFDTIMEDYHDLPRKRSYKWYQSRPGNNWKFICNGGVSLAAMAILEEDTSGLCEEILDTAYKSNHELIRNIYDSHDGSYFEGLSYWQYALRFLSQYSEGLKTACKTNFDLTDYVGIRITGYFPKRLSSNTFTSFNYGDATESNPCDFTSLWLADEFDIPELAKMRRNFIESDINSIEIRDLFFIKEEPSCEEKIIDTDFVSIGATNAVFRDKWDINNSMYAAIHFGDNAAPHAHFDTGTFILEYNGKRFFSDLGKDNYNIIPYRGTYRFRAEGHNTVSFNQSNKDDQVLNASCFVEKFQTGDIAYAISDMSPVYYDNKKIVRGLKMNKPEQTVIIQDEINCLNEDKVYWFAHTKANINLVNDTEAILTIDDTQLKATIIGNCGKFEIMDAKPLASSPICDRPQGDNSSFKKLAIILNGQTSYNISIAFSPLKNNTPTFVPIKNW